MRFVPIARRLILPLIFIFWTAMAAAQESSVANRAAELMHAHQYADAIKVLSQDIEGKSDEQAARSQLMLGECYYMTRQYELARPMFAKAVKNLGESNGQVVAEYRLACTLFRLNDFGNAADRITAFLDKHPGDAHVGKLLTYEMLITAGKGAAAQADLEKMHDRIYGDLKKYGYDAGMEADDILCDFYRKNAQEDKALALYAKIVHGYQQVIAELKKDQQGIPDSYTKAHDNAALQLGIMYLEKKQPAQATQWLENVRYDAELKTRAVLMLAKAAFDAHDYKAVIARLGDNGFVDGVDASMRSDVYLMLGLAQAALPDANPAKVEEALKKVAPESRGFVQAQSHLGDLYRDKKVWDAALKAYKNVVDSPDYGANALNSMSAIAMAQAIDEHDAAKAKALHQQAGVWIGQLLAKFPGSPLVAQAKERAEELATMGIEAGSADSADLAPGWERAAREKPGSIEGAQSLQSLIKYYAKPATDASQAAAREANYAMCASACDRLLDEKVYTGAGLPADVWKSARANAFYYRGVSELASLDTALDASRRVKDANADRAAAFFASAKALVDPKALETVKSIELGSVEALFKSDNKESKARAEQRFGELENDYGDDGRFQKLAVDLAEWYRQQGRLADAGKMYMGVAARAKDMPKDDLLKLLFTAGSLYSKAGYEAQQKPGDGGYAIYIYPKETIQIGEDLLKTFAPMQIMIDPVFPRGGQNVTAAEAIQAISVAAKQAFVWSKAPSAVGKWMDETHVTLKPKRQTAAAWVAQVLDLAAVRLTFDIGLTDGTPTLPPPAAPQEGDAPLEWKPIEIYAAREADARYKPLLRPYGPWNKTPENNAPAVMLFNVLQRIEAAAQTRILWAEGIDKQEKLAAEFRQPPPAIARADATCAQVLHEVLEGRDLRFRIIRRDIASEDYDAARDAFNRIRRIDAASKYGEKALFTVALNYYNVREFDRMKVVLKEYLKIFDNPANEYYQPACFWVGWALENEQKFKDAEAYYARAIEERLVLYKPVAGENVSRDQLKGRLGYDSQYSLSEPVGGQFKNATLSDLAAFFRVNSHVEMRLDASVIGGGYAINREQFKAVSGFDVLCDVLQEQGLSFKVENLNADAAEKAYYRLAMCYRKDNLMDQALENCNLLLSRYPQTQRRRDASKLMVEIYRGLRDYRKVRLTLEELRKTATSDAERGDLDRELADIYFDNADYEAAAKVFATSMAMQQSERRLAELRDGYARCLLRQGKEAEALSEYERLAKAETPESLAGMVDGLMVFYLKFALGKVEERQMPQEAQKYIVQYEHLSDAQRSALSDSDKSLAAAIYYTLALVDLQKGRRDAAMVKLQAASTAPDDRLAGEAGYLLGMAKAASGDYEKAREAFEYLLFTTRSAEATVKATYELALVYQELGRRQAAVERLRQVIDRFPDSPYASKAAANELLKPVATNPSATAPGR